MIGPGRLVLVVGPSGAGKDTLIRAARDQVPAAAGLVFPRRVITRPASEDEDNEGCDLAAFEARRSAGGFALSWHAHDLHYAIPIEIEGAIRNSRCVVCNISRMAVAAARARYANVLVLEVTAPRAVLRERLASRGRDPQADWDARIERSSQVDDVVADATVSNAGPLNDAVAAFVAVLMRFMPAGSGWKSAW